jgi:hypothetical protein
MLPAIQEASEKREVAVAPPSAEFFGVNDKDRAWVDAMQTPHPVASLVDRVMETGARDRIARKLYVAAAPPTPPFDAYYAKYRSNPGWRTYEVPCGHFVMIDRPERVAEILLEA